MKARSFFVLGLRRLWTVKEGGDGRPGTRITLYRDENGGLWGFFERGQDEAMFATMPRWEARSFLRRHKAPPEVLAEAFSRREATG